MNEKWRAVMRSELNTACQFNRQLETEIYSYLFIEDCCWIGDELKNVRK